MYTNKSGRLGLSIPEVAIILLILSSVVGGAMSLIPSKKDVEDVVSVEQKLDKIEEAIFSFYLEKGYLPCPASSTVLDSTNTFGVSTDCSASAVSGVTDITPTTVTMTIRNGVVPVRTLNLPDSYMYDPWGSRISYSIVKKLGIDKATYAEVLDVATEVYSIRNAANDLINNLYTSVSKTFVTHTLLSYGKNRNGGATPCVVGGDDYENCNGDNIYKFIPHNYVEGSSYYDDHLRWYTNKQLMFGAGLKEEVVCNIPSSSFAPSDISDMTLWLDAKDSSTFEFYSGNNIQYWNDKSYYKSKYLSQSSNPAVYDATGFNGMPTINLVNSLGLVFSSGLYSPPYLEFRNFTFFFVGKQNEVAGANYLFTAKETNLRVINLNKNGYNFFFKYKTDEGVLSQSYSTNLVATLVLNIIDPNSAKSKLYINGELKDTGPKYGGLWTNHCVKYLNIGRNIENPTVNDFNGQVSEMIMYTRALTNSEREYVENYLKAKWGFND